LIGSVIAAALGAAIIALEPPTNRKSPMSPSGSVRPA
jgi:hypothetical protein